MSGGAARPDGDPGIVGRLLVVPAGSGALSRSERCAAALVAAGHIVHAVSGPGDPAWPAVIDHEAAILVMEEGGELGRGAAALLISLLTRLPVAAAGAPRGEATRVLVLAGAYTAVEQPDDPGTLLPAVAGTLRFARAVGREARHDPEEADLARQIGASEEMAEARRLVPRAAQSPSPVVVIGEPGAGKQIVARAVHLHPRSRRRGGPFVRCPLAGLPPAAMREELFGSWWRPGRLALAHRGTIFLDDIGLLPADLQAALLGLLAAGPDARIEPVGGGETLPADVRLVAGSTLELDDERLRAVLREDFRYAVGVLSIRVAPLRRRPEDLPVLAGRLLDRAARELGRTLVGFSPDASALLQRHHWPGNVRELEEHVERAARRARGPVVEAADLPELASLAAGRGAGGGHPGTLDLHLALDETLSLTQAGGRARAAAEIMAIRRALKQTGGNVTHAARLLGVSRMHLQRRMKRYGLRETG
ncbi:MAG TPA: sigma 54-interacting transcriptional regulator [Candidatus Polarisedimenticolia bacterium]|nr:sigma 54-interacting transcriptional regulator [Candidatus Polarisedimenticolia bacterium]